MRVNEGYFLDGLKFLFKLPRFSESVHTAFSSSMKSDYGAQKEKEKKKKENRFRSFPWRVPKVKSASRKKHQKLYNRGEAAFRQVAKHIRDAEI